MSFVRKNTQIEDVGIFSDLTRKAKDMKKSAVKKVGETWRNTKKTIKEGLDNFPTIDDALNTISEKDANNVQDLIENGKQFVPPNKL
tara:strand:- start:624 stop:884 length:261 start_codon:yes stop_codon:yes gene_type:complete